MAAAGQKLVAGDDDLERDQKDHDQLQPQRALGVDDVGERGRGVRDDLELAVQYFDALAELVFVLEPRIEPFEIGPVPEHIGTGPISNGSMRGSRTNTSSASASKY